MTARTLVVSAGGDDGVLFSVKGAGSTVFSVDSDGAVVSAALQAAITPEANIADPTGGATEDAEARTAIAAILDLLEAIGVMEPEEEE